MFEKILIFIVVLILFNVLFVAKTYIWHPIRFEDELDESIPVIIIMNIGLIIFFVLYMLGIIKM